MGLFDNFSMIDPGAGNPLDQLANALGGFGGDSGKDSADWVSDAVSNTPPEVLRGMGGAGTGGNGGIIGPSVSVSVSGNLGRYDLGGPDGAGPGAAQAAGRRGMRSQLLASASANAGFRITTKKLKALLKKMGQAALLAIIRLTAEQLLWLLQTAPRRGARGPFMRTMVKRVRKGRSAEHQLSKYSKRAGIHHHRAPPHFKKK